MQVIAKVPCVTRAGEALVSLAPGRTYDLDKKVAQKLVSAGFCVAVEEPKAPAQVNANKTEPEKKPAPVKKAPVKSAGAAPENKGA